MIKCQICQHDNPDGTEYCEDCGASLKASAQAAGGSANPAATSGTAASDTAATAASSTGAAVPASTDAPATSVTPAPAPADVGTAAAASGTTAPPGAAGAADAGTAQSGGGIKITFSAEESGTPPTEAVPPETSTIAADASAPATGSGTQATAAGAPAADAGAATPGVSAPAGAGAASTAPPAAPSPAAPSASGASAPSAAPGTGAAPTAGGRPRLVAQRYGATTGEEYPLLGERLVVGRFDAETGPVDIDLSSIPEAAHLSRHHAELYREADGRWHVKDLGSTNGIFVKPSGGGSFGPRLTEPRALSNGDELAFGNARFIFRQD